MEPRDAIDYCPTSRSAFFGLLCAVDRKGKVEIVAAGTSEMPVAQEAERTLRRGGYDETVGRSSVRERSEREAAGRRAARYPSGL